MKIEHKIYLSNAVHIALIVLIGISALQSFNEILTKFRFTAIADELNTTFLEMRLSEKNYFLYGDDQALLTIRKKIDETSATLTQVEADITKAVGIENFERLRIHLDHYAEMIDAARKSGRRDGDTKLRLRQAGQILKEFSENITALERQRVGAIIARSKRILLYSFWAVVLFAFLFSHAIVSNIGRSLRRIVELTKTISRGNYQKIDQQPEGDELGAVVTAINSMAGELQRRENEILQSKRLASIGVLIAGVAHELNNPVNNISMIAQTYEDVYDRLDEEARIDFMRRVEEQSERLRVIIKNLLDFSRPNEPKLELNAPNDVIQKTLDLVQNMLDVSDIKTRLQLDEKLPPIYVDEHQIQQVLVNIATNAIQAMPEGGELTIASRFRPADDEVEIEIRDTGKGISSEFLDHIFDPFFTTKAEGGTGLGLSVSYGIIKNHSGNIRVESSIGAGTAFFITLPSCNKLQRCNDDEAQHHDH